MKLKRKELAQIGGVLGLVLLFSGYIRYTSREMLDVPCDVLLIAGGVLLLAWLVLDFQGLMGFFSKRSSRLGANTGVLIVAVVAILIFLNYLGFRHHKTFDLTTAKLFTLSDQTKKIVEPIKSDVNIYLFDKAGNPEVQQVRDQMSDYEDLNRRIHFEVVDPTEQPGMAKEYGITEMGQLVVVNGPRTEHAQGTTEEDVTSAILKAISSKVNSVCFLEGHGEKSITDESAKGFSGVADELKKENYLVSSVNLVTSDSVPASCSAIVDAGPTKPLFPQETQMITKYLDGGGKALFLLDPGMDPGLDSLMNTWNVKVGDNYVIDVSGVGRLIGTGPGIPLVVNYGPSPIVKGFENMMTFFPLARTISVLDQSKADPQTVELLKTSPASFTVPNLGNGTVKFDAAKDARGPLSLGVSAENTSGKADARLVVIGNSTFATNQWFGQQRNGDLFFNAINWLTEEENLISIRPKEQTNRRVTLTQAQSTELTWFSMVILPLLVILGGIYIWIRRR